MTAIRIRRYTKTYEQLLLSPLCSVVIGLLVTVVLPAVFYWGPDVLSDPNRGQAWAMVAASAALLVSSLWASRVLSSYPGGYSIGLIFPQLIIVYFLAALAPLLFRVGVSRYLLGLSGVLAIVWFQVEIIVTEKFRRPKLAVVNRGLAGDLLGLPYIDARELYKPDLDGVRFDAVVADFECLTPEWERFLARCALDRIAVHDARSVYESVTGRVRIHRMTENEIGSLLPSPLYEHAKVAFDGVLILASLPVVLPIVAVAALAIALESPGPVLYCQTRIGRGNKPFVMYKLRSMRCGGDDRARFAGRDDPRATRVGKFLRKYRIDELPQFFNVLKGDMSLIGPRPEQPAFVRDFDRKLPFYIYRHVVKPGITGWAQVRQGYAASVGQTREKIEYDFYYIKHGSLFLDVFILFLTVKALFTESKEG